MQSLLKRAGRWIAYRLMDLAARDPKPMPRGWIVGESYAGPHEASAQFNQDAGIRARILGRLIEKRKQR